MMRLSYITLYKLRQLVRTPRRNDDTVSVRGLSGCQVYHYSRTKLSANRSKIAILLSQLPDAMKQSSGQADYWMRARFDWSGREWVTELADADELLAMGRAIGFVSVLDSSDVSCDMPRVLVLDVDASAAERQLPPAERNRRLSGWSYQYIRRPLSGSI
jgi:hypothetical protein